MAEVKIEEAAKLPTTFGPSFKGDFPDEMRAMVWPLCCGFGILSGFKSVNKLTDEELDAQIANALKVARYDFQVFGHENMRPKNMFLTLNSEQLQSKKIMAAIARAGFVQIGEGKPRGTRQGLFLRDTSGTWKTIDPKAEKKAKKVATPVAA